jgi:hypothetical protein
MFKTNEYFDGKVKSIGFRSTIGRATVGVMAPGEYEFGTDTVEHMSIVSGEMDVRLPGEQIFTTYKPGQKFVVTKDAKFQLKVPVETAYLCIYQ